MKLTQTDGIRDWEIGDVADDCLAEVVSVNRLTPNLQVTTMQYIEDSYSVRMHRLDRDPLVSFEIWYDCLVDIYRRIFPKKQA